MIGPAPACLGCRRYTSGSSPAACEPYPSGIPGMIFMAAVLHTQPYEGDNGLTFVPDDGWTLGADGSVTGPDGWRWTIDKPDGAPGPNYVDYP